MVFEGISTFSGAAGGFFEGFSTFSGAAEGFLRVFLKVLTNEPKSVF